MPSRSRHPLITLLAGAAIAAAAVTSLPAEAAAPRATLETTSSATDTPVVSARFERWATINKTSKGYYLDAGQQNTHLVITRVDRGIRFADSHTDVLRSKPDACDKKRARVGIVVVCRVPATVSARRPMTLKVFTRLGDDSVDSSSLSAAFELYMLCDAGREVIHAGAGDDFVNGAHNRDRIWGGDGNDWLQAGLGEDKVWGGRGRDHVVGGENRDAVHGGRGNDSVGGAPGNDRLFAGKGTDVVHCGPGKDNAHAQRIDRVLQDCESVIYG